ncbi:MAG TPA: hypothetical protein VFT43_09325 [Candidatus Polarisedimenticolia bacterium]|nr:hypothetical protein [Candidatus Polarisedimenticolia bacterium]
MRRRMLRWFVALVLAANAAAAVGFLFGGLPVSSAGEEPKPAAEKAPPVPEGQTAGPSEAAPTADALRLLGQALAERKEELDRRQTQLEETLRGAEVLKRAALAQAAAGAAPDQPASVPAPGSDAAGPTASPAQAAKQTAQEVPKDAAFLRLQRAYENMEPDSAAKALSALAGLDREAVVSLLLGWKPRTSGAVLDALSQTNPALAADLSYRIWARGGKGASPAARTGR